MNNIEELVTMLPKKYADIVFGMENLSGDGYDESLMVVGEYIMGLEFALKEINNIQFGDCGDCGVGRVLNETEIDFC